MEPIFPAKLTERVGYYGSRIAHGLWGEPLNLASDIFIAPSLWAHTFCGMHLPHVLLAFFYIRQQATEVLSIMHLPKHISMPLKGSIPDPGTAIRIAVAVWEPIHGKEQIKGFSACCLKTTRPNT